MSSQVITIKVDPITKEEAHHAAEQLGMPLSVVIKAFLKQFIRTKTVTFSAQDEEVPNEYFKGMLAKARKNWKEGKGSPTFHTGAETVKWLEDQGI